MNNNICSWIAYCGSSHSSAACLKLALQRSQQQRWIPFVPHQLCRTDRGKPFFHDLPQLHFSLSHCREEWIGLFAFAPVGIDIEAPRSCRSQAIARRFFHPAEQAWLQTHPDDFFRLWCAKESVVKRSGRGIDDQFSQFSVVSDQGLILFDHAIRLIELTTPKKTPGMMCLGVDQQPPQRWLLLD